MDWYRVIKTIKGRRYHYWQKTYREGGRVKTLNKYIGPFLGLDRLYHGTNKKFIAFDMNAAPRHGGAMWGNGIYVTESRELAQRYGEEVMELQGCLVNPFVINDFSSIAEMAKYLGMQDKSFRTREVPSGRKVAAPECNKDVQLEFTKRVAERGHDGVIFIHRPGMSEYVFFNTEKLEIKQSTLSSAGDCQNNREEKKEARSAPQ